jgi:hypothetical protein
VFEHREGADQAVEDLRRAGVPDDDIGFAVRGGDSHETVSDIPSTAAGEGAATGMLTGGVLGGLVGAAASGLIPGFGPVIAAGILSTILGGAAVGAAAGGMLGALMGLGIPEDEARYYQSEFEAGRVIITVKTANRHDEVERVLRSHGAYDVREGGIDLGSPARRAYGDGISVDSSSRDTTSAHHTWEDVAPTYRDAWERQHGMSGRRWYDEEAGFHFGYAMSHDPRFRDRAWSEAEEELRDEYDDWAARHGYMSNYDDPWSHVRDSARGTWEALRHTARA